MASEGWGFPMRSRKAHYFVEGRSLCGGWMYLGEPTPNQESGSPDDCKACARALAKISQEEASDG